MNALNFQSTMLILNERKHRNSSAFPLNSPSLKLSLKPKYISNNYNSPVVSSRTHRRYSCNASPRSGVYFPLDLRTVWRAVSGRIESPEFIDGDNTRLPGSNWRTVRAETARRCTNGIYNAICRRNYPSEVFFSPFS